MGFEGWKSTSDLRGENLPAVAPPPLIGTPVYQNTGTFVVNLFAPFHKKQFSFVILLFLSRILVVAYRYCFRIPRVAYVSRLRIPRIAYLALYSRACIPSVIDIRSHSRLSSSFVAVISRVRSHVRASSCPHVPTFARSHVRTFARHRVLASAPRHASTCRLTYRPARAIRARAR